MDKTARGQWPEVTYVWQAKTPQSLMHWIESQKWYSDFGLACSVTYKSNWKCVVHH